MSARTMSDGGKVRFALAGFVVMAAAMALAMNFQRLPAFGADETYHAEFSDAAGLQVGEEVRVAGVKVGKVTEIALDGNQVVVSFTVSDVDLGTSTTASIEIKTLLGQHYLNVTPAGASDLESGSTIPLARTTTPMNLVPAFQQLTTTVQELDTEQVAEAFDALAETLDATAPEVSDTLRGLTRLSRAVSTRDEQIRELLDQASHVSGVVAARDRELGELLRGSDQILQTLVERRQLINRLITGTRDLAVEVSGLVDDNEAALAGTLGKLDQVLQILRDNRTNIDDVMKYGSVYAREFTNVGGSGEWFDATVKAPRDAAVCMTQSSDDALAELLGPALSALGNGQPCLPLAPPSGDAR